MNILSKKISILHYIQLFFYSLVAVTPLIMNSKTSEIFEFNKMIFIYFITLIVSILYFIHLAVTKERIVKSFFFIILVIFFITQLLSTYYSIDRHTSIFGYYGRWNGGILSIFCYITLAFIFVQAFTIEKVKTLLKISLGSSFIVVLWGLLAKYGLDFSCFIFTEKLSNGCWTVQFNPAERMFSTIGQPNWLGAYLAFHFFVGLYFFLRNFSLKRFDIPRIKNHLLTKQSGMFGMYLILNFLSIIFTKSRSTLLAVIVSLSIGSLIFLENIFKLKKRTEKFAIILFALGIFITFFIGWRSGYIQNFFSLPTKATAITDSFDIRKVVWKGAIDLGYRYPLFGSGVETFAYAYYFTRPMAHNITSEWDFIYNKAHNEYLNYFGTTGFIGLSAYLLVIIGTFILFWRYFEINKETLKLTDESLLVTSIMLGYITILITNFFGFSVSIIQILFYLTPAFVIALLQKEKESAMVNFRALTLINKISILSICLVLLSGLWYLFNYYGADIEYADAKTKIDANDYPEALLLLDSARKKKYEHVYEDKLSYTLANIAYLYSFDNEAKAKTYIALSDAANVRTLRESPQNILYWRTRGKNYYLYYQVTHTESDLDEALEAFEKMIEIAPTDAQSHYTLGLFYWIASTEIKNTEKSTQYYSKALSEVRKVLEMRPTYIEAQELLAEMLKGA